MARKPFIDLNGKKYNSKAALIRELQAEFPFDKTADTATKFYVRTGKTIERNEVEQATETFKINKKIKLEYKISDLKSAPDEIRSLALQHFGAEPFIQLLEKCRTMGMAGDIAATKFFFEAMVGKNFNKDPHFMNVTVDNKSVNLTMDAMSEEDIQKLARMMDPTKKTIETDAIVEMVQPTEVKMVSHLKDKMMRDNDPDLRKKTIKTDSRYAAQMLAMPPQKKEGE
jgi:hypothetical protein